MKQLCSPCFLLILGIGLVSGAQDQANTASIRGKIIFAGVLPPVPATRMNSDPFCAALPQPDNQQLEDVIVYVKPLSQTSFPPSSGNVVLDHRACRFVPHTLTLQVGQALVLANSDGTHHITHAWPKINASFNISLIQGAESVKTFDKEELPLVMRDDIHNWEFANIGVFSHPYHTVSRLNGSYELALPAGSYEIVAWHAKLGKQTQSFEVRAGETRELNLLFK